MEIKDGFIVGIFNHCDRWCERCALTSHCGLFADAGDGGLLERRHLTQHEAFLACGGRETLIERRNLER